MTLEEMKTKLRVKLRDEPELNYLIGEAEFTDDELEEALEEALAIWNEEPPAIQTYDTPADFPWQRKLMDGAVGELYQTAAAGYRRNQLAYNAGGVSVDDKNKAPEYEGVGREYRAEFKRFVLERKREINFNNMMRIVY